MAEHSGAHQDSRPGTRRGSDSARRISEQAPRAANPDGKPVLFRLTATDWARAASPSRSRPCSPRSWRPRALTSSTSSPAWAYGTRRPARQCARPSTSSRETRCGRHRDCPSPLSARSANCPRRTHSWRTDGRADVVMLGRALLCDPYLALRGRASDRAARPVQYHRAQWPPRHDADRTLEPWGLATSSKIYTAPAAGLSLPAMDRGARIRSARSPSPRMASEL